jgi:hypothetical protein
MNVKAVAHCQWTVFGLLLLSSGAAAAAQIPSVPVFYVPIHDAGSSLHADYGHGMKDVGDFDVFQLRGTFGSDIVRGTLMGAATLNAKGATRPAAGGNVAANLYGIPQEKLVLLDLQAGLGYSPFSFDTLSFRQIDIPVGVAAGPHARTPSDTFGNVHLWLAPRVHVRHRRTSDREPAVSEWAVGGGVGVGLGVTHPKGPEVHVAIDYLRIKDPLSARLLHEWSVGFSLGYRM